MEKINEHMQSLDTRNNPIPEEEMTSIDKYPDLQEALGNLQGNILRGHGRPYSVQLLLQFKAGTKEDVQAVKVQIRNLTQDGAAVTVTSALKQRQQSDEKNSDPDSLFCSFLLSAAGYRYLNPILLEEFPEEFRRGMRGAQPRLNDPACNTWEEGYEDEFHAMALLACANLQKLRQAAQVMRTYFKCGPKFSQEATVFAKEEWGKAEPLGGDRFIDHFRYVDGISQPLFFQKDVDREKQKDTVQWNPSAGPRLVLIRDPGVDKETKNAFGSYLVFRKLAQDVPGYNARVTELARRLDQDEDYVRALIIGRYPNGRPLVPHNAINNFAFQAVDPRGEVCPYYAHIRKVNPRGDTAKASEHRIARRGITYEAWGTEPQDSVSARETYTESKQDSPVGLLFMCYQSDLKKQFEFIQSQLANNENFLREKTGVDPIIGQGEKGKEPIPHEWPVRPTGGQPQKHKEPFGSFVTLRGGEYFFAPSIRFLKSL